MTSVREPADADPCSKPAIAWTRSDSIAVAVLLAVSGVAAVLRWKKLETLVNGDPGWWLHESLRVARGEIPYRDFSWQYPPLGLVTGVAMRWFGTSFTVAQVTLDIFSVLIVFLSYLFLQLLMPRLYAALACVLLIAVGMTARTFFTLFSLLTYSPALILASIGLLLFLIAVVRYLRSGVLTGTDLWWWGLGCFIAMGSKQEPMLAIPVSVLILAIADRTLWFQDQPFRNWMRHYLVLAIVCFAPTVLLDAWFLRKAGWEDFAAAMGGYGLATAACPWWPTGIGLFGMIAALGGAAALAAILFIATRRQSGAYPGPARQAALWLAAVAGLILYASYDWYVARDYVPPSGGLAHTLAAVLPVLLGTSAVLRPVMWAAILLEIYLLYSVCVKGLQQEQSADRVTLLVILTVPVSMSVRSLFGSTISPYPEVPAICYPLFTLLGPYLLMWLLQSPAGRAALYVAPDRLTGLGVASVMILYAFIRVAGGFPTLLSNRPYMPLSTRAGVVYLLDYDVNREIYRYIVGHTSESDLILDGPYSGGMNFASGRASPAFTMLFKQIPMPRKYVERDLQLMQRTPPKVAIFDNAANWGSVWGLAANVACEFPQFVWIPNRPSARSEPMPIITFLTHNYRTEKIVGQKVILVPR